LKRQHENNIAGKENPNETSLERYYEQLARIKSSVWWAENEWRLMWRSKNHADAVYKMPIAPECIRAVYMGLALPGNQVDRITDAMAKNFPRAEIWFATKRHGDLALEFKRKTIVTDGPKLS
jgi:hypothetical protein